MESKRTIAIVGATGAQGGGLISSMLCDNAVRSSASGCEGVSNEYSD